MNHSKLSRRGILKGALAAGGAALGSRIAGPLVGDAFAAGEPSHFVHIFFNGGLNALFAGNADKYLTGNVFEWTGDPYGDGGWRALRGGSFVLDGVFIRNAMRMRLRPEVLADDTGFRVLRENADTRFGPSHEDSR